MTAEVLHRLAADFSKEEWLRGAVQDNGGFGLCVNASREFVKYLIANGLITRDEQGARWEYESFDPLRKIRASCESSLHPDRDLDPDPQYPHLTQETWSLDDAWHCVVRVEDEIFDFTARQFDMNLPYPFIWKRRSS